jgi:hypothetical protein
MFKDKAAFFAHTKAHWNRRSSVAKTMYPAGKFSSDAGSKNVKSRRMQSDAAQNVAVLASGASKLSARLAPGRRQTQLTLAFLALHVFRLINTK